MMQKFASHQPPPQAQSNTLHVHALVSATAGMITLFLPQVAQAATTAPLVGAASKYCLTVVSGNNDPGTPIDMWTCQGGTPHQQWEFTRAGELRTFGGTRCLDVATGSKASGTPVVSYTCTGGNNQKWRFAPNGSVVSVDSGLCLDVKAASTALQAQVQMYTCHGGSNQRWKLGTGGTVTPPVADTAPPSVPSRPSVAALTCSSATLSWGASSDNVGVAFYDVYRDGQLVSTVSGKTLSTGVKLVAGMNWGFYVNARDAAGNVSQASATLPVKVPQCQIDSQAPTTPTGLRGSVAGTTATLTWSASKDNVGVSGYDVYRGSAKVGTTAALSFSDSGLAPNARLSYTVAARDAQNNVSPRSVAVALTTGGACANTVCSVQEVAKESDLPWGMLALPDGQVLYSRRDVQDIARMNPANGSKTSIGKVPEVSGTDGEGGLLGLAALPGFPTTDSWLYIYHTSADDNRVVRIQYKNGSLDLGTRQVLLKGIGRNKFHNGGRLRFGPDGKLYIATGDAQNGDFSQDTKNLAGKILRINQDGSVPSDNPFGNAVWSYGHRNPQGLAFDSKGRLWQQEFGNGQLDETNLVVKGGNYGWPNCEGTVSQGGGGCATPGYVAPKYTYPTSQGSCSGVAVVRDVLYVACLRGKRLYRHVVSGDSLTNTQELFVGTYGRLRTVEPSIDGGLWLSTTNGLNPPNDGDKDNVPNNSNNKVLKINLGN